MGYGQVILQERRPKDKEKDGDQGEEKRKPKNERERDENPKFKDELFHSEDEETKEEESFFQAGNTPDGQETDEVRNAWT